MKRETSGGEERQLLFSLLPFLSFTFSFFHFSSISFFRSFKDQNLNQRKMKRRARAPGQRVQSKHDP